MSLRFGLPSPLDLQPFSSRSKKFSSEIVSPFSFSFSFWITSLGPDGFLLLSLRRFLLEFRLAFLMDLDRFTLRSEEKNSF